MTVAAVIGSVKGVAGGGGTGVAVGGTGVGVVMAVGGTGVAVDTACAPPHPASKDTTSAKPNMCCSRLPWLMVLLLSSS